MAQGETVCFWITLTCYAIASGGYIQSFVLNSQRLLPKLTVLVAVGLVIHSCAIGFRYLNTGHLPWAGDYENALMGGWFIIVGTLFATLRNRSLQGLGASTMPLVIIMMLYGFVRHPVMTPMAENLKSYWLYVHVYFAWLAFGSYALAMATGVIYLLKKKDGGCNQFYGRFPSLERLDELIFRYMVFGFVTDSIMITSGAFWAKDIWGSYWSWDPVETWSLIAWLTYGSCIHMRVIFGWRNARQAWMAVAALSTVIIAFFGVSLMAGSQHVFNQPMR
ncbi:cytochrome c biogenesis protein CcsA [Geobacter sp. SVR]|uniref:cytochrome c biogenesis protein CcsA n=1 Tax=Geobacter sp. SVR TaxID=2495594 RepID=UPI00143EFFEE|nr:cytochrome c biogenesis protein CcsA [Geobacter sp. SVR]BCS52108.1 c-type cytochrome biogenesis protein CcsB [Geobacter sp. SVR]GCF86563.1 c-type cytochrome biogenesis protein CcsB [Geobacter sp. SVR]